MKRGTLSVWLLALVVAIACHGPTSTNRTISRASKRATNSCVVTGCSSHVCAAQSTMTTCEWNETYACYASATCERQTNGQCGWTMTPQLQECLSR